MVGTRWRRAGRAQSGVCRRHKPSAGCPASLRAFLPTRRRALCCSASSPPTTGATTAWMSSLAGTCLLASCRSTPGERARAGGGGRFLRRGFGKPPPLGLRAPSRAVRWLVSERIGLSRNASALNGEPFAL